MQNRDQYLNDLKVLRASFEASPVALMVVDKNTDIKLINREMEVITGYSCDELEGKRRWSEFVFSEDRDVLKKLIRMLKAGGTGPEDHSECRCGRPECPRRRWDERAELPHS